MNRILSVLRRKVADYSSGRSPGLEGCSRSCRIASPSPIFRPSGVVKRLPSLTVAAPRRLPPAPPPYSPPGDVENRGQPLHNCHCPTHLPHSIPPTPPT